MLIHTPSTAVQILAAFALLIVAMTWLLAVPAVLTPINFASLVGLSIALGWVALKTCQDGQSADSVGQLLYETANEGASRHPRGQA